MKKIIILIIVIFLNNTLAFADYSNNPDCRGYGLLETKEKQKCLEANKNLPKKEKKKLLSKDGKLNTSNIREKTGKFFKKLGVNTDSTLFKTGKYSDKK
tara:strand:- start:145 stop:441 length:297 start_codon:yes stop_codon:yes gene_type:complete